MFYIKFLVFCFLSLRVVWAASVESVTDEFPSMELDKSVPISSDEAAATANWLPICQQVQVNELQSNTVAPESNVVYVPQEVPGIIISPVRASEGKDDVCEAPNGRGLKNLIKEAKSILPYDRLKSIVQAAAQDVEVKKVKELLTSEKFRSKVRNLVETRHFMVLQDYVCRALNLDIKYYVQFVKSLIGVENLKEPTAETTAQCHGRSGIRGLIQDLEDALPKQKLRDLYTRLLISDDYLVAAVRQMKSAEFRQLLENVTSAKEFNELRKMLNEIGVPLHGVKELIDKALGWQGDELGYNDFEEI